MSEPAMSVSQLQQLMNDCPYHRLFDLTILETDDQNELKLLMRYSPSVERLPGSGQYHGGALASLGDIAGAFALGKALGVGGSTVHFAIEYFRPVVNTNLLARALIRRTGKTFAFVDIDIENSVGLPVAVCRGVYAFNKSGPTESMTVRDNLPGI